jgi:predicted transcriptional regulator
MVQKPKPPIILWVKRILYVHLVMGVMGRVYEFRAPVRIQEEKKKEDSVKWQRAQEMAEEVIDEMESNMPFKPADLEPFDDYED